MSNEGPLVEERNFEKELTSLINHHSLEKRSGTPDFILAEYLVNCLKAYEETKRSNDTWHK